ncbi:hypothetical protein J6590_080312, partial [Homalodisca vitripennis]
TSYPLPPRPAPPRSFCDRNPLAARSWRRDGTSCQNRNRTLNADKRNKRETLYAAKRGLIFTGVALLQLYMRATL